MRKLDLPQNHIIKSVALITLLVFISFGTIGGCSNNGGGNSDQALTENDFSADSGLRAKPDAGVLVMFLEHPESDTPPNDTGDVGRDTIPMRYDRAVEHTFCWEDEDIQAQHSMELEDEQGNTILTMNANGNCESAIVPRGNYLMHLNHDGRQALSHPIFIIPQENEELSGIFNKLSNILAHLDLGFTQPSNAQTVAENINTLLRTRACSGCNLTAANLSNADLRNVRLDGANLTLAFFHSSDLSCVDPELGFGNCTRFDNAVARAADFGCIDPNNLATCVNLTDATFASADLNNADFNGADLTNVFFNGSDMTGANLQGAFLFGTTFEFANLTNANLTFVDMQNTEYQDAIWCDGTCVCGFQSFNTCAGCAPIETCTGL